MPGSTPTNVPSSTPIAAYMRFSSVSAFWNPSSSRSRVSITGSRRGCRASSGTPRPQKKYQLATDSTAPTMTSRTSVRLPSAQAQPAKSSAPVIAQPRMFTSSRLSTRMPTSLPTVTQSAGEVRSMSSPASASATSPRAVATASSTDEHDHAGADEVGEHPRADRVAEADVEAARVDDRVDADQRASTAARTNCALSTVPGRAGPAVAVARSQQSQLLERPGHALVLLVDEGRRTRRRS